MRFNLENLNDIIVKFLAAGGLGYINYWLLEKLDVSSSSIGEKTVHVTFGSLLCSIPDFFVYILLKSFFVKYFKFNNDLSNVISLSLTVIAVFFFTIFLGKKIIDLIYRIMRKVTTGDWETGVAPGEPWSAIDKSGESLVYLYNFEHKLIACGYGTSFSGSFDSNYSINLQPFDHNQKKESELNYYDAIYFASFSDASPIKGIECKGSSIHVNLKQGFIMVIFKVVEDKENKCRCNCSLKD